MLNYNLDALAIKAQEKFGSQNLSTVVAHDVVRFVARELFGVIERERCDYCLGRGYILTGKSGLLGKVFNLLDAVDCHRCDGTGYGDVVF